VPYFTERLCSFSLGVLQFAFYGCAAAFAYKRRMQIGRIYAKETTDCEIGFDLRNTLASIFIRLYIFQFHKIFLKVNVETNNIDRSLIRSFLIGKK